MTCQKKSYRLITLYSGSKGNSTLLMGESSAILIDAGKSARALCTALASVGLSPSELSAVFITHEHSDHVSALDVLTKKCSLPIHIMDGSASKLDGCVSPRLSECMIRHSEPFTEKVGEFTVTAFPTPHDSRMSVGYRIKIGDGESASFVGLATDIGHVTREIRAGLFGCDAVVLESNHDVDMLMGGAYPYDLKLRIRSKTGHLSNADSASFARELWRSGTRGFILAHLSEENNTPQLARSAAEASLADTGASICVASPNTPVELWAENDSLG